MHILHAIIEGTAEVLRKYGYQVQVAPYKIPDNESIARCLIILSKTTGKPFYRFSGTRAERQSTNLQFELDGDTLNIENSDRKITESLTLSDPKTTMEEIARVADSLWTSSRLWGKK